VYLQSSWILSADYFNCPFPFPHLCEEIQMFFWESLRIVAKHSLDSIHYAFIMRGDLEFLHSSNRSAATTATNNPLAKS
jgi:hypothetical protein